MRPMWLGFGGSCSAMCWPVCGGGGCWCCVFCGGGGCGCWWCGFGGRAGRGGRVEKEVVVSEVGVVVGVGGGVWSSPPRALAPVRSAAAVCASARLSTPPPPIRRTQTKKTQLPHARTAPDANADAAQVEPVQELVHLWHLGERRARVGRQLLPHLGDALCHERHDVGVPPVDRPQQVREARLLVLGADGGKGAELGERLDVPVAHLEDLRLGRQAVGQVFELGDAVREADGQLAVQELGREGELPGDGGGAKVEHVLEGDARLLLERVREDVVDEGAGDAVGEPDAAGRGRGRGGDGGGGRGRGLGRADGQAGRLVVNQGDLAVVVVGVQAAAAASCWSCCCCRRRRRRRRRRRFCRCGRRVAARRQQEHRPSPPGEAGGVSSHQRWGGCCFGRSGNWG